MPARLREDLPRAVRELENVFVPAADGCRLAARIWLPEGAESEPVPAIVEALPYRKRDFMRRRDEQMHRYYAAHGYASVRLDLRGSGDSDGLLEDEYLPQETADVAHVIGWLAEQPWCSGSVGMTGISWGGFNSLQVAAARPPALKAIITLCASDDRYADDAHYMGGLLLNENQIWGTVLFALNALPPDPEIVGDRWRALWRQRLEANRPFPGVWLRHPRRDDYWRSGSVCEDWSSIRCPVYAIGGWADGYSNSVARLLAGLQVPRKGLIGPWAHTFPHNGVPGPAIGYLQEALRWWDHWLKGVDTGILDGPQLRVWMQESVTPEPFHEERAGRWVAEPGWPSPRLRPRTLHLGATGSLSGEPGEPAALDVCSPQTTGLAGGDWCGFGNEGEAPLDQRLDDGRSLVFDTAPLEEPLEILGTTEVVLRLASDRPVALVALRLNDVAPDGTSARVTFGLKNLAHRTGHAEPEPLEPGRTYDVPVRLNDIAHRFPRGHVIRLAISTCYWPMAWPSPERVTLTIHTGGSSVTLPVRPPDPADAALPPFAPPEAAGPTSSQTPLKPPHFRRTTERDLTTHHVLHRLISEGGDLEVAAEARIEEIDLDLGHTVERRFTIGESDPLTARTEIREHITMRRGDWRIAVHATTELTCDRDAFRLRARLEAREGEQVAFDREWDERIPRDLV